MKNITITLLLMLFHFFSFSQKKDTVFSIKENIEIVRLNNKVQKIEIINSKLVKQNIDNTNKIVNLSSKLSDLTTSLNLIKDSMSDVSSNLKKTNNQNQIKISTISHDVSAKTIYIIISLLSLAVLILILYFISKNKINSNSNKIDSQISKTNKAIQSEYMKLDTKLIEILNSQMQIQKVERNQSNNNSNILDHKLPLKVGEEIHRMRKRIENMPSDIKGLSALNNSLQRLEEEFNDNGYEIEKLEGKKYVDGMKVEARFVDNPDIPKGEEIITDVIRPAIKYNGVLIQVAKVEVSKS